MQQEKAIAFFWSLQPLWEGAGKDELQLGKRTATVETHGITVIPPPTSQGRGTRVDLTGHKQGSEDYNSKTI